MGTHNIAPNSSLKTITPVILILSKNHINVKQKLKVVQALRALEHWIFSKEISGSCTQVTAKQKGSTNYTCVFKVKGKCLELLSECITI